MKNIRVKSLARATVSMTVPELNLRKVWARKGAIQTISDETLEQAYYSQGVEFLFKTGLLYIEDKEVRIKLGLEASEEMPEIKTIIELTDEYAEKMLKKMPIIEFKKKAEELSEPQLMELATIAVSLSITDYQKCKFLTDKTGKEVLKIVLRNKEEDEADGVNNKSKSE